MDPLSVAASVTALVSFALQSSTFICQFVKAIHDAPNKKKALASRVDGLHQALLQIAGLINSQHCLEQDESHPRSKNLRLALRACADDLNRLQLKLQTLNSARDKGLRRARYAVKLILGSKEFEDADAILKEHTQTLGLQLEILGSHLNLEHGEVIRNVKGTVEGVHHTASTTLAEVGKQSTLLERFRIRTEEWQSRISDSQQLQSEENRSVAEHLATKIDAITPISSPQYDEIIGLLREIKLRSQPSGSNHGPSSASSSSESTASANESITTGLLRQSLPPLNDPRSVPRDDKGSCYEPARDINSVFSQELADCIEQLCSLASKKPGSISSQEAESVIDDLDYILSVIEGRDKISRPILQRGIKRKTRDSGQDSCATPNIKRIRRIIAPSQRVDLGRTVINPRHGKTRHLTTYQATTKLYEVQGATVMISHSTKRPRLAARSTPKDAEAGTDAGGEGMTEVFGGTVTLRVPDGLHGKKLTFAFNQHVTTSGINMLTPAVSFHSIRPMDSKVFRVVAEGSVQELMDLLQGQGGHANIWDCDPEGRSLLHYALSSVNVQICSFLIENHADVDSMEPDIISGDEGIICPPLEQLGRHDFEADPENLALSIECKKLLLEAGADATLSVLSMDIRDRLPAFTYAIYFGTADTLRLFLDRSSHYLDLEARDHYNRTALMTAIQPCNVDGWIFSREKALILIDHGAKIDTQDRWSTGCFHGLFKAVAYDWIAWEKQRKTSQKPELVRADEVLRFLLLLLDRGGDAFAINSSQYDARYNGHSVTERAFTIGLGKTWLAALRACIHPYNLSTFLAQDHARCCKRTPKYCKHYLKEETHCRNGSATRSNFTKLMLEDPEIGSVTLILELPSCLEHDCQWAVWDYLEGLPTQPDPKGGLVLNTNWVLGDRTPDLFLHHNLPDFMYHYLSRWRAVETSDDEDTSESEAEESVEEDLGEMKGEESDVDAAETNDATGFNESKVEEFAEKADEELTRSGGAENPAGQGPVVGEGALHSNGNSSWEYESCVQLHCPPAADHTPTDRPEHQLPAYEAVDTQGLFSEPTDGCSPHASGIADFSMEGTDAGRLLETIPRSLSLYEDPWLHFNPWG